MDGSNRDRADTTATTQNNIQSKSQMYQWLTEQEDTDHVSTVQRVVTEACRWTMRISESATKRLPPSRHELLRECFRQLLTDINVEKRRNITPSDISLEEGWHQEIPEKPGLRGSDHGLLGSQRSWLMFFISNKSWYLCTFKEIREPQMLIVHTF